MNTIYMVILIGYLRQRQGNGHQKCIFSKIFYFVYYLIYYVILKRILKKRKNYMAICWIFFWYIYALVSSTHNLRNVNPPPGQRIALLTEPL